MRGKKKVNLDYSLKLEGLPAFCETTHFFTHTDSQLPF
jgi:hypothetical protein